MGVAYPNHKLAQHFNASDTGHPAFIRPTVSYVQQQFHQRAMSPQVTSNRIGNRAIMPNSATRNRSAFGGTQHGSNSRVYSKRGRSSLGHATRDAWNNHGGNQDGEHNSRGERR